MQSKSKPILSNFRKASDTGSLPVKRPVGSVNHSSSLKIIRWRFTCRHGKQHKHGSWLRFHCSYDYELISCAITAAAEPSCMRTNSNAVQVFHRCAPLELMVFKDYCRSILRILSVRLFIRLPFACFYCLSAF